MLPHQDERKSRPVTQVLKVTRCLRQTDPEEDCHVRSFTMRNTKNKVTTGVKRSLSSCSSPGAGDCGGPPAAKVLKTGPPPLLRDYTPAFNVCSCPPFECTCAKHSSMNPNFNYVGRSPLAANTPSIENYTPALDSYSSHLSGMEGFPSNSPWTPAMEWPTQTQQLPYKTEEPWTGCYSTQDVSAGIPDPGSYDNQSDCYTNNHHYVQNPSLDHGPAETGQLSADAAFQGDDPESLFSLDNFQPSDIFAMEDPAVPFRETSHLNAYNVSTPLTSQLLPVTAATSSTQAQATDTTATRFLQCLDDIIGDCLLSDPCPDDNSLNDSNISMNNPVPSHQFSTHQQWPTLGPPTMMTTITKTTKITASIEEKVLLNAPNVYHEPPSMNCPQYSLAPNEATQPASSAYLTHESSTQIMPSSQKFGTQIPVSEKMYESFSANEVSHSCPSYQYNDCFPSLHGKPPAPHTLHSPPTFQNLDTLETTHGSPVANNSETKYDESVTNHGHVDTSARLNHGPSRQAAAVQAEVQADRRTVEQQQEGRVAKEGKQIGINWLGLFEGRKGRDTIKHQRQEKQTKARKGTCSQSCDGPPPMLRASSNRRPESDNFRGENERLLKKRAGISSNTLTRLHLGQTH
ncbi:hypothetical protein FHG87_014536 [Trinorchestia longiramus]|nr:hypothetical protein FHG87_014536 [Trinorchestia longiramus]